MRTLVIFVLSVLLTYALGSATSSWLIANNVANLGVAVPFADRLAWIGHDLIGMTGIYLPIVAIGFAVAFGVAALVLRIWPGARLLGYVLAGGVALFTIHQALYAFTDIHALPATRTAVGLGLQVLAGMAGGWLFAVAPRRAAT